MPYNWSVVVIWLEMGSTKCLLRPSRNCEARLTVNGGHFDFQMDVTQSARPRRKNRGL